jgi:hypothetical protein
MDRLIRTALLVAGIAAPAGLARADGLAGSPSSMVHQHQVAVSEEYSFLRTPKDVQKLASAGALVRVEDNEDLTLSKVSYPFTRPEVKAFVERFAAEYHDATGTKLVVTSLTRPESTQPKNAHKLSVHPAGMAVDLRVPADAGSRAYLEKSLLAMERAGVLDVTREHTPAHYHIAVFADAYGPYAARLDSLAALEQSSAAAASKMAAAAVRAITPPEDGSTLPGLLFALAVLGGVPFALLRTGARSRA